MKIGVGNYFLQVSDMLNFKAIETLGNHILCEIVGFRCVLPEFCSLLGCYAVQIGLGLCIGPIFKGLAVQDA
jgi:hypothetical protein